MSCINVSLRFSAKIVLVLWSAEGGGSSARVSRALTPSRLIRDASCTKGATHGFCALQF